MNEQNFENMRPFIIVVIVNRKDTILRFLVYLDYHMGLDTRYQVSIDDCDYLESNSEVFVHTFAQPGAYHIKIRGNIDSIRLFDYKNTEWFHGYNWNEVRPLKRKKLLLWLKKNSPYYYIDVEQWGDIQWKTMDSMFCDCYFINFSAKDVPDLSNCKSMQELFANAFKFNSPIGDWDVSNVINMSRMFADAASFNQPIGGWDVSNVTTMCEMFKGAVSFNQSIGDWDVSNVTTMCEMFKGAVSFNQPIGDWDVSNVEDMCGMFADAASFNQPIGDWDVSNVTNMAGIFEGAVSFNQPIGDWDVSNVTNMSRMFADAASFNQPLGGWDVSNVTTMCEMFKGAVSFNQPIGDWDVSNVEDMRGMFADAASFNQPIGDWDVSNVENMCGMFADAASFNQPLGGWDVSNVENMCEMFKGAVSFNQPIGDWDVSNVGYMNRIFYWAESFNQLLEMWDICCVDMDDQTMFYDPFWINSVSFILKVNVISLFDERYEDLIASFLMREKKYYAFALKDGLSYVGDDDYEYELVTEDNLDFLDSLTIQCAVYILSWGGWRYRYSFDGELFGYIRVKTVWEIVCVKDMYDLSCYIMSATYFSADCFRLRDVELDKVDFINNINYPVFYVQKIYDEYDCDMSDLALFKLQFGVILLNMPECDRLYVILPLGRGYTIDDYRANKIVKIFKELGFESLANRGTLALMVYERKG